jgi:hypothetical protein
VECRENKRFRVSVHSRRKTQAQSLATGLAGFISVAAVLYVLFLRAYLIFPGIQSGADQIYRAKVSYARNNRLFREESTCRVLVCGSSKVLSGFQPSVFDSLAGTNVCSFNLGLPGAEAFVWQPEILLSRGDGPTHVVLTQAWGTNNASPLWNMLRNDDQLMWRLFPFRKVVRDSVLFYLRAQKNGGVRLYYQHVLDLVERMKRDRGYHFIESQSHYSGHRLPNDYHADGDDPNLVKRRELVTSGPIFEQLKRAMHQGGFRVFVAPSYYREGEAAPPKLDPDARGRLADAGIQVCGPDYWVLPPKYFSDPAHLNPEGAREYTERLWRLLDPFFKSGASSMANGNN